jgi:hypothetical protein
VDPIRVTPDTGHAGRTMGAAVESPPGTAAVDMTVEAFADTILPGARRHADDRAVAGAAPGGGAVHSGVLELLRLPASGLAEALDALASLLDEHARSHAAACGLRLDDSVPPFVALPFEHRTSLVRELVAPGHPEREGWVALAMFSFLAFDTAAHMSTKDALAAGHPGLTTLGFAPPGADGAWAFPHFSYGRPLAALHPATTSTGSLP